MDAATITIIGQIILEGMKAWNESRRTRFKKEHLKLLQAVSDAENQHFPDHTDDEEGLAKEELKNFLKAYLAEVVAHNGEINA